MYKDRSVCVIIPVYNEEKNIASVIENIPEYLDEIIV
ncbi:MAG: glycosyltransferase family 2 protein, partial [Candidatus Cloacimonetes bacterium]|nr:glycosyltransferase family 2 protein [Candidatus Cloacimonadota bacterium]